MQNIRGGNYVIPSRQTDFKGFKWAFECNYTPPFRQALEQPLNSNKRGHTSLEGLVQGVFSGMRTPLSFKV